MLIRKPADIKGSEVTDPSLYLSRRAFMRGVVVAATTPGTGALCRMFAGPAGPSPRGDSPPSASESWTPLHDITHYNNFYEFSTSKRGVADAAKGVATHPWAVAVEGLVARPRVFDLDDLLRLAPPEERVYRLRCVEGWSMVIPWLGFPLAGLLKQVEPTSQARYVEFQTLHDPLRMPNQETRILPWPYVEGLRLDEAMHPLTLLATGLYGEALPPQNGAPVRLVVPWKYGFKSIKSIVRIRLVAELPTTTWNRVLPREYGFYANVNPLVDHPRWGQAKERRIGETRLRDTLPFNGYAEQVAHLYSEMDLRTHF